uniref:Nucleophosmin/nucleoplasmin 2 n=1 Tax=Coturnix japonica TaxID=93934 RepID=A0A8C2TTW4_COTJA
MPFMGWGGSPSDPLYGGGLHLTLFVPIGCELSSERSSYTFQMPEEWQCEQQLALRTICLGAQARDEFHVLELVPNEEGAAVPLATLKPSVLPMVRPHRGAGGGLPHMCPICALYVPHICPLSAGHAGWGGADAPRHFPAPSGVRAGLYQRAARGQ